MSKRLNRPEQLRLELGWDYLKWVVAASEGFDFYEVTTRRLLTEPPGIVEASPVLDECFNHQHE